jgi:hypothetical protein
MSVDQVLFHRLWQLNNPLVLLQCTFPLLLLLPFFRAFCTQISFFLLLQSLGYCIFVSSCPYPICLPVKASNMKCTVVPTFGLEIDP